MTIAYKLSSLTLQTDWPIKTPLLEGSEGPRLQFGVTDTRPRPGEWVPTHRDEEEDAAIRHGRVGDLEVIRFALTGDAWFVAHDQIVFHLTHPEHDFQVEVLLLGTLVSYWLQKRDVCALHSSAAGVDEWSVGILGPNGVGKTTICLALVDSGLQLVTDDLLAVTLDGRPTVHPSFPEVRLWPADARDWVGTVEGLELAHPQYQKLRVPVASNQFASQGLPLTSLYVPSAGSSDLSIEPIEGPDALFHLMLNTFGRYLVDTSSNRGAWVSRTGELMKSVPLFLVGRPEAAPLGEVAGMISEHAHALAQSKRRS